METSQTGIDLIKSLEGFSATIYECEAKKPTIGYGHVIREGEAFSLGISKNDAENLLKLDISHAENVVNAFVNVQLNQNEFDALVSFVYNIGRFAFMTSTLLKKLNLGKDKGEVAVEFDHWIYADNKKSNGLINRRFKEKQLFQA